MIIEKKAVFAGHQGAVYIVKKENDNNFFSGSGDNNLVQWDVDRYDRGVLLGVFNNGIYALESDPSRQRWLVGNGNGEVISIDSNTKTLIKRSKIHDQHVFKILLLKNGVVLTAGGDGTIATLNFDLDMLHKLKVGNFKIRSLLPVENEAALFIGCGDGSVALLDLTTQKIIHAFQAHTLSFSVNALCLSPDGKLLFTASRDACINVFDINDNFKRLDSIPAHNYAIYAMQFNAGKSVLATASRDKTIKLWHPDLMFIKRLDKDNFNGHNNSVNTLEWLHDDVLLSAGDDRTIIAWKISN
jgi:WD40 repeat protein